MLNYVCTVLVNNDSTGSIFAPTAQNPNPTVADAGKFVVVNCDTLKAANATDAPLYITTAAAASSANTIKVGLITNKSMAIHKPDGTTVKSPIIRWSNEIKAADIKSYSYLNPANWTGKTAEDTIEIDFSNLGSFEKNLFAEGGKRIITRLTFKDMPHRYRKWTESYEYVTKFADFENVVPENNETEADARERVANEYIETIASDIAKMINKEWKRARVQATATGKKVVLVALPYDDDDNVETLNVANKVRFNANVYFTDPAADGWESSNKHFPTGVVITKTPGEQYPASAKLVRDREFWGMGYQGILNRGEGTWPIIKPEMQTNLSNTYYALTLEFENMYRAADDIQRKTKQNLEIYGVNVSNIKTILDAFVAGVQQDEIVNK